MDEKDEFKKDNLPIKVEDKNLKLKENTMHVLKRAGNFLKYTAGAIAMLGIGETLGGLSIAGAGIAATAAAFGTVYMGARAFQQINLGSSDDTFFTGFKSGNKVHINQEPILCLAHLKELLSLDKRGKTGFMELQTVLGLSKMKSKDANGKDLIYTANTHPPVTTLLKRFQKLGFITDYEEKNEKEKIFPIEKLTFGNSENLLKKDKFYDITFKRTEKPLDREALKDPEFRRQFRQIFNPENGLLVKRPYKLYEDRGMIHADYKGKKDYGYREINVREGDLPIKEKKRLFKKEPDKNFDERIKVEESELQNTETVKDTQIKDEQNKDTQPKEVGNDSKSQEVELE